MTTESHSPEVLDAGAAPVNAPVAPAPAPGRDVTTVQADLLEIAQALEDNTDWTKREQLMEKRGRLRHELEAIERAKKPLYDEKKLAAAEKPKQGEQADPTEPEFRAFEPDPAYQLEVPSDLNQEQTEIAQGYAEEVGVLAQAAGIPATEAQTLMEFAFDMDLRGPEGIDGSNPRESISVLSNRYGEEAAKRIVADAQSAVRRLGPTVAAYLDQDDGSGRQLGNLPSVLTALAEYHRGTLKLSPAEASKQLTKLRASKEYMAGDHATVDRVALLHKLAARGQSNELAVPKRGAAPAPTSQEKIQARIKDLRANPAYLDRDSPAHKEVVAQVAELYRKLDG